MNNKEALELLLVIQSKYDAESDYYEALTIAIDVLKSRIKKPDKTCKDCVWLNLDDKHTVGYPCMNPNKKWKHFASNLKYKGTRCCKMFEGR